MSRIGEKIKQARLKKNMQLKQLAKSCGVSESYLADVESGKKIINDSMIKKLSGILGVNLDEPFYREEEEKEEIVDIHERHEIQKAQSHVPVSSEWQSAFSSIIKDIPVYDMEMTKVIEYKHLPVIDKKVEGYNPEKLMYIAVEDDTLTGFRIRKGDIVMVVQNPEMQGNGFHFIECDGQKVIRLVKRLGGDRLLLMSHGGDVRTEARGIKEIRIIGHCIKAEINLRES